MMNKDNKTTSSPRTPDKEDKKNYYKMVNTKVVRLRLTSNEMALLQSMMHKMGAENTSAFIRYKLFGLDPDRKVNELIKRKDTDELVILLRNQILDLTEYLIYFRSRYEKDMRQLYKEEGVDVEKWQRATNYWHSKVDDRIGEVLSICRKVARELNLTGYFKLPSASMEINSDKESPEDMDDELAAQLYKERTAMGRIEDNKTIQQITISGTLLSDAVVRWEKNGKEYVFFQVLCYEKDENGERHSNLFKCSYYSTNLELDEFKKGDSVTISGRFNADIGYFHTGEPYPSLCILVYQITRGKRR